MSETQPSPGNTTYPESSNAPGPRILRELKTLRAMIKIYCLAHHAHHGGLCDDCRTLEHYALKRLAHCPFKEVKPTCGHCSVHCYNPSKQKRIVKVMRYSGPRMIYHHPLLAVAHLFDEMMCKRKKRADLHPFSKQESNR